WTALDRQSLHPRPFRTIEKDSVRTDELERVPFNRIMARGDGDPAAGAVVLDGELDRGGRRQSHPDHVAPDRPEPGDHRLLERGARRPCSPRHQDEWRGAGGPQA